MNKEFRSIGTGTSPLLLIPLKYLWIMVPNGPKMLFPFRHTLYDQKYAGKWIPIHFKEFANPKSATKPI